MLTQIKTSYSMVCSECEMENDEASTTSFCTHCKKGVLDIKYAEQKPFLQLPLVTGSTLDPIRTTATEVKFLSQISKLHKLRISAKLEYQNPTGSFKDRGSLVEVKKAIELGAKAVVCASTGNMAASVALYCAFFGVACHVFVPATTPEAKLRLAKHSGAKIVRVNADYSRCELQARQFAADNGYYLAGDFVARREGQKSFSWELYEQLGSIPFDFVVLPVGCGTFLGAIHKGFVELRDADLIAKIPAIVAVQPEGCCPAIEGVNTGKKVIHKEVATKCNAVKVSNPLDQVFVQRAVNETGGFAVTVTEEEVEEAMVELATKEGIYGELSGCLGYAAVKRYHAKFHGRLLLAITGTGWKDMD